MPGYNKNQLELMREAKAAYLFDTRDVAKQTGYNFNVRLKEGATNIRVAGEKLTEAFMDILGEPRTIKTGDPNVGDLQIKDFNQLDGIFKEHDNKPLHEIGRHIVGPVTHFSLYAIANGVSVEEIGNYVKNPDSPEAKATKEKLVGLRDNYVKMVVTDNLDEYEKSYVSYIRNMKKELPGIVEKCSDLKTVEKNAEYLAAMGVIQTLFLQDFPAGNKPEYAECQAFKKRLNETLQKQGEGVTVGTMYSALSIPFYCTSKIKADHLKTEADMKEGIINKGSLAPAVFVRVKELKKSLEAPGTIEERLAEFDARRENDVEAKAFEVEDTIFKSWNEIDRDILDTVTPPAEIGDNIAEKYLNDLTSSKRTILRIGREDSELFTSVKDSLAQYLNGRKSGLSMDRGNLEKLRDSCQKYLEERNPSSEQGKDRYRLISKIFNMAENNIKALPQSSAEMSKEQKKFVENNQKSMSETFVDDRNSLDARIAGLENIKQKFSSRTKSVKGDERIKEFLDKVDSAYNIVDYSRDMVKGPMEKDLSENIHYKPAVNALARVQVYEILKSEFDPATKTFKGNFADVIRMGHVDKLVSSIENTSLNGMYINPNANNLDRFMDEEPAEFLNQVKIFNSHHAEVGSSVYEKQADKSQEFSGPTA